MSYASLSTRLFGRIADKYSTYFIFLKEMLVKADMQIPFRSYVSMIFFSSTLALLISIFIFSIAFNFLKFPFLLQVFLVPVLSFLVSVSVFLILVFYPFNKASGRRRSIETNLPFLLTHMGSVAAAGVPPPTIFKLVSKFKEYGEVAREMEKIVKNMEVFGLSPLTAIKQVATRTPSKQLEEVLYGFITTTESGGDIKTFLKNAGEQALFEWRIRRERFLQQLSAYAEFYTGVLIAAPLFLVSLFVVMGMIQPTLAGYNIKDLMKLSVYLFIPALNLGFLLFLRGVEVEV